MTEKTVEITTLELERAREDAAALEEIRVLLHEYEKRCHVSFSSSLPDRARYLLGHYEREANRHIDGARRFRDDIVINLAAIELVITTAQNAYTHAEKNARLRGVGELIQIAVERLKAKAWETWHFEGYDDSAFASESSLRWNRERVRQLERDLEEAREALTKAERGNPDAVIDTDAPPF